MASAEVQLARWRAHPQFDRVRSWMGTHTRILAQLHTIRASAQFAVQVADVAQLNELRARVLPSAQEALEALELQLDAHSILEDRKLFPFLDATFPSQFAGALAQFAREHKALDRLEAEVAEAMESLARITAHGLIKACDVRAPAEALRAAAMSLDEAMCAHFVGEEARCVDLMLGLSAEQAESYAGFKMVPRSKL